MAHFLQKSKRNEKTQREKVKSFSSVASETKDRVAPSSLKEENPKLIMDKEFVGQSLQFYCNIEGYLW